MTAFLGDLIRNHGWHVAGELGALALVTVVSALYLRALLQGQVRSLTCPSCGRVVSRALPRCPRCGGAMTAAR